MVVVAALLWLACCSAPRIWAERRPQLLGQHWPYVYSLSLAVYCTSWTFYGTVTQAQRSGWPIPPTFIGTILLYAFGFGFLQRLHRIAREQNSTSLADLVATRLGKNSWLAAAITFVAVLGIIPYIALQLKAVTMSYGLLTEHRSQASPSPWQDSALYVALAMALFAMLFGTRRASLGRTQPRPGDGDGGRVAAQAGRDAGAGRVRLVRSGRCRRPAAPRARPMAPVVSRR